MAAEEAQQSSLPMVAVRDFDFSRDIESVLRFQVEIYERNFPGFIVTEVFLRDYRRQLRRAGRQWTEALYVACDGRQTRGFLWVGLVSTRVGEGAAEDRRGLGRGARRKRDRAGRERVQRGRCEAV